MMMACKPVDESPCASKCSVFFWVFTLHMGTASNFFCDGSLGFRRSALLPNAQTRHNLLSTVCVPEDMESDLNNTKSFAREMF